ncbi:MAG: TonB-dependent receptor [Sinobacteraceae bacterium]|nr:TonB-dependent receptor [Nevskiaceae bacterium]
MTFRVCNAVCTSACIVGLMLSSGAFAAAPQPEPVHLDALTVTANAMDRPASQPMQSVTVITRRDIEHSTATDLQDLLAQVNGVSISRRGAPGVQADIGIRGSNFEQTLVLLDGVPIHSPQSGHLTMDLPVPLSAIERIEIVKGPGAIQYGGSGIGGVVNIITRRATHPQAGLEVVGGSHASRGVHANIGTGNGTTSNLLSASISHFGAEHDSRPDNADIRRALYTGNTKLEALQLDWGLATSRKAFGAWGFYSDAFPNAQERIRSHMAWAGARLPLGDWQLRGRGYWRRHDDHFLTIIGSQGFLNRHSSQTAGFLGSLWHYSGHGTTVIGSNIHNATLHSNALHNHHRLRYSMWMFHRHQLTSRLSAQLGLNRVHFGDYGTDWLPSAGLSWKFNEHWRAFASWGRSARAPSYTELFLDTSGNRGNPQLVPERSSGYELGVNGQWQQQSLRISLFRRATQHRIDWVRMPGTAQFQAVNLDDYKALGGDITWKWQPNWRWLDSVELGYSRLRVRVNHDSTQVKYAFKVPRQTWRAKLRVPLMQRLNLSVDARFPDYRQQFIAKLLSVRLQWKRGPYHAYLGVQNLLDDDVVEAGFAPIAGRWVMVGVGVQF